MGVGASTFRADNGCCGDILLDRFTFCDHVCGIDTGAAKGRRHHGGVMPLPHDAGVAIDAPQSRTAWIQPFLCGGTLRGRDNSIYYLYVFRMKPLKLTLFDYNHFRDFTCFCLFYESDNEFLIYCDTWNARTAFAQMEQQPRLCTKRPTFEPLRKRRGHLTERWNSIKWLWDKGYAYRSAG